MSATSPQASTADTSARAGEALQTSASAVVMEEQESGVRVERHEYEEDEQHKKPEKQGAMETDVRITTALTDSTPLSLSSVVVSEPFALSPMTSPQPPSSAIPTTDTALAAAETAADDQGRDRPDGGAGACRVASAGDPTTETTACDGSGVVGSHRVLKMSEFIFIEGGNGANGNENVFGVANASDVSAKAGRDKNRSQTPRMQQASSRFLSRPSADSWVRSHVCVFVCVCVRVCVCQSLCLSVCVVLISLTIVSHSHTIMTYMT